MEYQPEASFEQVKQLVTEHILGCTLGEIFTKRLYTWHFPVFVYHPGTPALVSLISKSNTGKEQVNIYSFLARIVELPDQGWEEFYYYEVEKVNEDIDRMQYSIILYRDAQNRAFVFEDADYYLLDTDKGKVLFAILFYDHTRQNKCLIAHPGYGNGTHIILGAENVDAYLRDNAFKHSLSKY